MGHCVFSVGRRIIAPGAAQMHPAICRTAQPSDPNIDINNNINVNQNVFGNGFLVNMSGVPNGFPLSCGQHSDHYGENMDRRGSALMQHNTFEDLNATYPSTAPGDAGDVALGAYIQSGMGGNVPRPEMTGNDLRDFIYFIRRGT
jgi:hypothetical protein